MVLPLLPVFTFPLNLLDEYDMKMHPFYTHDFMISRALAVRV